MEGFIWQIPDGRRSFWWRCGAPMVWPTHCTCSTSGAGTKPKALSSTLASIGSVWMTGGARAAWGLLQGRAALRCKHSLCGAAFKSAAHTCVLWYFLENTLLLKMLIGKIIAIAQRRRINFHGKRGEEKKHSFGRELQRAPLHLPTLSLWRQICLREAKQGGESH